MTVFRLPCGSVNDWAIPTGPHERVHCPVAVPGEETDHVHHRSVWVTHGSVNGVDFWSEADGHRN